mgnify:FL=1
MIQPGDKVQVLYPEYAAGKTGVVLAKEMGHDGAETGYWLVKIDYEDMILALLPQEVKI